MLLRLKLVKIKNGGKYILSSWRQEAGPFEVLSDAPQYLNLNKKEEAANLRDPQNQERDCCLHRVFETHNKKIISPNIQYKADTWLKTYLLKLSDKLQ